MCYSLTSCFCCKYFLSLPLFVLHLFIKGWGEVLLFNVVKSFLKILSRVDVQVVTFYIHSTHLEFIRAYSRRLQFTLHFLLKC